MGVVFFLGFVIIVIIIGLLFLTLVTGIILLIVGTRKKKKYELKGEKRIAPKGMIIAGTMMTAVPIVLVIGFLILGGLASMEEDRSGQYSLVSAVDNGDYDLLKRLLEDGAPADSNEYKLFRGNMVTDENYATPLWEACSRGNYEMVKLLLAYGADPDRRGPNLDTAVELVLYNGRVDLLELLLSGGADLGYKNAAGNTYLVSACRLGEAEAVKLLLTYGADPNVTDGDGVKLLDYADTRYRYIPDYNTPPADEADCKAIIDLLTEYGARN